ncbi:exopolysaccharide production protein ExoQ [Mycoplana sp. BE70]|uniref:O-antigen ligase family protein n=1 Tax=Mycoplana sp. BE70 TaxID=2817775 RepID=UPI00285DBF24|nr:O-antigen ligase [Mycoplana sp. BE70]MDR6758024.1 exopolysaccharide production protein ExoQ [Mycoplana sp. BE70]
MRIAKASLVTPGENRAYGIVAVALSLFVFAYSTLFGQVSILAYYGLWLPLVLLDYRRVLGNYSRYLWILPFAVFACLSMFWSAAPAQTLRTGIQYLSHVICALIAMRTIDIATLARGVLVGVGLVLLYSFAFGVYHADPLDGTVSFVGAFASKNQLGFYASLGVYFAVAAVTILGERRLWMAVSAGVGLLSGYALAVSQSATSVLTTVAVVGCCIGLNILTWLTPRNRKSLFVGGTILFAVGTVAFISAGGYGLVLGAFGKDATLTGRTYLWQQGIEAAAANPWFGVGYQAYWVQGFSEAERLWEEFYIGTRTGFHFHNTFIGAAVETGAIGLLLLCMVLVVTIAGHLGRFLSTDRHPEAALLLGLAVLLAMRAFVEIDIMTPYHVGSFLLYVAAGKLTIRQSRRMAGPTPWPAVPRLPVASLATGASPQQRLRS